MQTEPPPAAAVTARGSPGLIALLVFALFLPLLGVDLSLPGNPRMAMALGVDASAAQLGLALFAGCFGVMHLVYGPLADRFGRKPFMLGGTVLLGLSSVACALAPDVEILLIGRALQGVGAAAGPLLARAIIRDIWGVAGSARMMGYVMAAFGLAALTLPVIGGQLTELFDWRAPYWFAAGYAVAVLIWTLMLLPETRPASAPDRLNLGALTRNYLTVVADVRFYLVSVCGILVATAMFMWIAGSTFVLQTVLGYSPSEYSVIYGISIVAFIAFSVLAGRLATHFGSYRLVTAGVTVAGLGGALCLGFGLAFDITLYLLMPPVFITLLGHGLTFSQSMAASIAPFPHLAATASALFGFLQYGFNGILTWIAGLLFDGTATPMLVMMGLLTLSAMIIYWSSRHLLHRAPAATD